ncbi:MAG: AraC family transcriptional regulator ligand-binding domain-containing protein, partial [Myxococcota bacterium]
MMQNSSSNTHNASALAVQYIRLIGDQLHRMGVSVEHWLAMSQLTWRQLDDPSFELTYSTFEQLAQHAVMLTREPALGLILGERLVASTHGAVGYAVMNSGTMRAVLEVIQRFMGLRIAFMSLSYEHHPDEVRVIIAELFPLGDIRALLLEAVVLSIKNLLDAVSMGACQVHAVVFPFAT